MKQNLSELNNFYDYFLKGHTNHQNSKQIVQII